LKKNFLKQIILLIFIYEIGHHEYCYIMVAVFSLKAFIHKKPIIALNLIIDKRRSKNIKLMFIASDEFYTQSLGFINFV